MGSQWRTEPSDCQPPRPLPRSVRGREGDGNRWASGLLDKPGSAESLPTWSEDWDTEAIFVLPRCRRNQHRLPTQVSASSGKLLAKGVVISGKLRNVEARTSQLQMCPIGSQIAYAVKGKSQREDRASCKRILYFERCEGGKAGSCEAHPTGRISPRDVIRFGPTVLRQCHMNRESGVESPFRSPTALVRSDEERIRVTRRRDPSVPVVNTQRCRANREPLQSRRVECDCAQSATEVS